MHEITKIQKNDVGLDILTENDFRRVRLVTYDV